MAASGKWITAKRVFSAGSATRVTFIADLFNAGKPDEAIWKFHEFPFGANEVWSAGHARRRAREMLVAWDGNYGDLSQIAFWDGDPKKVELLDAMRSLYGGGSRSMRFLDIKDRFVCGCPRRLTKQGRAQILLFRLCRASEAESHDL